MKRILIIAASGLAAVAVYAVAAPAGEQAVTPKQFAALSKKVKNLQKELSAYESCVPTQAIPVESFGDPNGTFGYAYHGSNNTDFYTTALDVSDVQHASAYMLITNPQCASIINSGKKKAAIFHRHSDR
jgi:hypothetical protein